MNLDWIGTMSDKELREFRGLLERDLASARARGRSGKYSVQFCTTRLAAIDAVLAGRGVSLEEFVRRGQAAQRAVDEVLRKQGS